MLLKMMKYIVALLFVFLNSISLLCIGQIPSEKIQKIVDKSIDNQNIFGITISISKGDETWSFAAGNLSTQSRYYLASVTKMYTAAVIFKLCDEGKLSMDDSIATYLPANVMHKLHVYKGVDYSSSITIRHLLSNTSGLADYFEEEGENGESFKDILLQGKDTTITFDNIVNLTKKIEPHFAPGTKGKAFYSDGNFQLLGKIIETVTGSDLSENYKRIIFDPLGLKNTYLYSQQNDTALTSIYYKDVPLNIPKMMSCFKADGGIVSNTTENMIFLKAFLDGKLFSKSHVNINSEWNKIFFPFSYGLGLQRFKIPGNDEMIGHSGVTGSLSFYCPKKDVYITGTVNQINKPQQLYKNIMKIINLL